MPSKFLTLLAVASLASFGAAQSLHGDDFEAAATGYYCYQDPALVPGAPCALGSVGNSNGFDGWFNNPIEAGIVVNAPGTGSNGSDQYLDVSPALGCQDAVVPYKELATTGAGVASGAPLASYPQSGGWTLRADFRVPAGGLALGFVYFIVNNDYNNAGTATSWATQCPMEPDAANPGQYGIHDDQRLDPATGARYTVGGLMEGVWYRIRAEICLDANAVQYYIHAAGTDGLLGTGDDNVMFFSQGAWAGGGPVEIANLDLFSAGGQLHYDNIDLSPANCAVYPWQFNRPGVASMDIDGTPLNVFTGIGNAFAFGAGAASPGGSNHTVAIDGGGAPGDIGVVPAAAIPGSTNPLAGVFTANSLNVDITLAGTTYIFGGNQPNLTAPVPALNLAVSGAIISGLGGGASVISSQLAVLDATSPDGFACSRAIGVDLITAVGYIEPSTAAVDIEGFEASGGWALGGPGAAVYGANWQTNPTATGQFSVNSGGTPSGGTGPGSALEGTQYVYNETSGGANANDFQLEMTAGVLPLAAGSVFYGLHMNGATQGTFELREEDPNNPGTWVVIDTLSGSQGGSWLVRSAALVFGGTSVRLQIRAYGGTSFTADTAVDRLAIGL